MSRTIIINREEYVLDAKHLTEVRYQPWGQEEIYEFENTSVEYSFHEKTKFEIIKTVKTRIIHDHGSDNHAGVFAEIETITTVNEVGYYDNWK